MTKHAIEVITSVERRRRWSREDKELLVAACLEPVLSEIARAAGLHASQLFRWRKELCHIQEPRPDTASTLVPVIVQVICRRPRRQAMPLPRNRRPHRSPAGSVVM